MRNPLCVYIGVARLNIASNIRTLRKAKGLTQVDLAAKSGVSHRIIQEIEGGNANPTVDTLLALASAMDATLAGLIGEPGFAQAAKGPSPAPGTGRRLNQSLLEPRPDDPDFTLTEEGEKNMRAGLEIVMRFSRSSRDIQLIVQSLLWKDPALLLKLSADGRALLRQLAGVQTQSRNKKNQQS